MQNFEPCENIRYTVVALFSGFPRMNKPKKLKVIYATAISTGDGVNFVVCPFVSSQAVSMDSLPPNRFTTCLLLFLLL